MKRWDLELTFITALAPADSVFFVRVASSRSRTSTHASMCTDSPDSTDAPPYQCAMSPQATLRVTAAQPRRALSTDRCPMAIVSILEFVPAVPRSHGVATMLFRHTVAVLFETPCCLEL